MGFALGIGTVAFFKWGFVKLSEKERPTEAPFLVSGTSDT